MPEPLHLIDSVEKVRSMPPTRNNRIGASNFLIDIARRMLALNQCCSAAPPKILLQQHRPKAAVRVRHAADEVIE